MGFRLLLDGHRKGETWQHKKERSGLSFLALRCGERARCAYCLLVGRASIQTCASTHSCGIYGRAARRCCDVRARTGARRALVGAELRPECSDTGALRRKRRERCKERRETRDCHSCAGPCCTRSSMLVWSAAAWVNRGIRPATTAAHAAPNIGIMAGRDGRSGSGASGLITGRVCGGKAGKKGKKRVRRPGLEHGTSAWQADIIPT